MRLTRQPSGNGVQDHGIYGDPFNVSNLDQHLPPAGQFNPYAADPTAISGSGTAFYPPGYQTGPVQPPLYHFYQPYDGYRQDLQPYQRATYDFFISKELREEMQKKMFATQQVMGKQRLGDAPRTKPLRLKLHRQSVAAARTLAFVVPAGYEQQKECILVRLPKLAV